MKRRVVLLIVLSPIFFLMSSLALAQGPFAQMEALIAQLGRGDLSAYKAYCDPNVNPGNVAACNAAAAEVGLVSQEKAAAISALAKAGLTDDVVACQQGRLTPEQCFEIFRNFSQKNSQFAQQIGIPSPQEMDRRVREKYGKGPERSSFENLKKDLASGALDCGGAKTPEQCGRICMKPDSPALCEDIALKYFGPEGVEQLKQARSGQRQFDMPEGGGPGGCKGEDECHDYCEEEGHMTDCINFAVKNGFMTEKEAQMALKFAGKTGPGGCKREQCRQYCEDSAHQEECMNWAVENDLLPPEMKRMVTVEGPNGCRGSGCQAVCVAAMQSEDENLRKQCMEFFQKMSSVMGHSEGSGMMRAPGMGGTGVMMPGGGPGMMGGPGMGMPGGDLGMMGGRSDMMKNMMPKACQDENISNPQDCQKFCFNDPGHCGFGGGMGMPQGIPSPECMAAFQTHDPEKIKTACTHTLRAPYNNYTAQTVAVVKSSPTVAKGPRPVPSYLKNLAQEIKCTSFDDCQKKSTEMIKKDVVGFVALVDKYVNLKKAPADFIKVIETLRKQIKEALAAAKKAAEKKAQEAQSKKNKPAVIAPAPAPVLATNPCPTIEEKQWQPIPALPQPTKFCFGKRGDYHYLLAPSKSPQFPQYYFKTSLNCAADQEGAVKDDGSGVACVAKGTSAFAFNPNYCDPGFVMVPQPEYGEKPANCIGFLSAVNAFAMWPFGAPSSSYAGIPETELGLNIRCSYSEGYVRSLNLKGTAIECKYKDLTKDLANANDTKTKFEGYRLPDRYSMIFPLPPLNGSTTSTPLADQGAAAAVCYRGDYKAPFLKLKSQLCKQFTGGVSTSPAGGYGGYPH